jgi:hypothetical protein
MTAAASNAQFFIEGNLGVNYSSGKNESGDILTAKSSGFGITVSPKVGYWLNDRMAVGIGISYGTQNAKNGEGQEEQLTKIANPQFELSVFGRYQLFRKEKFAILAECSMGMRKIGNKIQSNSTTTSTTTNAIFISAYPILEYDLTERLGIIAICDFFGLGYSYSMQKYGGSENSGHFFNLITGTSLFNPLRAGFIYKF